MRKMYAASGNLFSDTWSWQSFVSPTCHVVNCLFPLDVQNQYSCYQDSSVIHGWFVYWIYGWEMYRLSKSSEIQFRMALFSFFTLPDAQEGLNQDILALLDGLQELHLDWWAWVIIVFDVFFFRVPNIGRSLLMRLVYARYNDLTYNSIRFDISLQNFKKPLDIFWPPVNTKRNVPKNI